MAEIKSCGFLIYRDDPKRSFLLMRHPDRWDLPKGHVDSGESELECALRELEEETGLTPDLIAVDDRFRYRSRYSVQLPRYGPEPREKELVIFLARLRHPTPIATTEHEGCQWFDWAPPHRIQTQTIDPLLAELAAFWGNVDP